MENHKIITLPESIGFVSIGITGIRIVMASIGATIILFDYVKDIFLVFLIISIIILDQFDGVLFRKSKLNEIETWRLKRRIFDSFGDRLCVQLFVVPILIVDNEFLIIFLIVLIKEVLNSSICVKGYVMGIKFESNNIGKLSSIMIGLSVIMWLIEFKNVAYIFAFVTFFTGVVSMHQYSDKLYKKNNST